MSRRAPAVVPSIEPLDLEEARQAIGPEADAMTDEDVREACDQADALSDILLQMFRESN